MKKDIKSKELLERINAVQNDFHKIENDCSILKMKLHELWWDIHLSEKDFVLKNNSIEK